MNTVQTQIKDINKKLSQFDSNFDQRVKAVNTDVTQVRNDVAKVREDLVNMQT